MYLSTSPSNSVQFTPTGDSDVTPPTSLPLKTYEVYSAQV